MFKVYEPRVPPDWSSAEMPAASLEEARQIADRWAVETGKRIRILDEHGVCMEERKTYSR